MTVSAAPGPRLIMAILRLFEKLRIFTHPATPIQFACPWMTHFPRECGFRVRSAQPPRDAARFSDLLGHIGALGGVGWGGRLARSRGSAVLEGGEGPGGKRSGKPWTKATTRSISPGVSLTTTSPTFLFLEISQRAAAIVSDTPCCAAQSVQT
jgi:hypothetical protein